MTEIKHALFGPAGSDDEYNASGQKSPTGAPAWYSAYGLDAYEYQAGRGVRAPESTFIEIGNEAKKHNIAMSLHAPYFISLSGIEPETRLKSIDYIKQSLNAASLMGADTIVIHTGSASKITRREAMDLAADTLRKLLEDIGSTNIKMGLETMGKLNQLGTLEEVIELCKISPMFCPVVDFGHLNCREIGKAFPDEQAYRHVFELIGDGLGDEYAKNLHCHFSHIEYTEKGEKCHLTFDGDTTGFGPDFGPLANVLAQDGLTPRIICESAGTQGKDALTMKNQYFSAINK